MKVRSLAILAAIGLLSLCAAPGSAGAATSLGFEMTNASYDYDYSGQELWIENINEVTDFSSLVVSKHTGSGTESATLFTNGTTYSQNGAFQGDLVFSNDSGNWVASGTLSFRDKDSCETYTDIVEANFTSTSVTLSGGPESYVLSIEGDLSPIDESILVNQGNPWTFKGSGDETISIDSPDLYNSGHVVFQVEGAYTGDLTELLTDSSWTYEGSVNSGLVVPEPGSIALLGLGLAALLRRRAAKA